MNCIKPCFNVFTCVACGGVKRGHVVDDMVHHSLASLTRHSGELVTFVQEGEELRVSAHCLVSWTVDDVLQAVYSRYCVCCVPSCTPKTRKMPISLNNDYLYAFLLLLVYGERPHHSPPTCEHAWSRVAATHEKRTAFTLPELGFALNTNRHSMSRPV